MHDPAQTPLALPWGPGPPLPLDLPPTWRVEDVAWPDLDGAIEDYPGALGAALDAPIGGDDPLAALRPGSTVAIVVDDPTRWTPVREALPVVLARLAAAGVRREDTSISVGVGRHHAVDAEGMKRRLGNEVAAAYRCFSPPVDDLSAYRDLGTTPEGVPVRVFRPVADADLRILIGSVLPHMQAGFGGGWKLIFPGTSHRTTLVALHRQGLGGADAARLLGGDASANPMRRAIHAAAQRLGPSLSISHLLGPPGVVLRVVAGRPEAVQDELAAEARRRFAAKPLDPGATDVVVVGNDPWPGDPMMSFKVLLQHRAAGRPGGVLVGFFWTDPAEIDRSVPMPVLRGIAATGGPGGWAIRRGVAAAERVARAVAAPGEFLVRWARELVVDRAVLVYAPPLRARVGSRLGPIRIFADQAALWAEAARVLGDAASPRCRVFPRGGLTYCPTISPSVDSSR